jgi:transposase
LQWSDVPKDYGPLKTLYNRVVRWSRMGVYAEILLEFARAGWLAETFKIGSTYITTHRTAASLVKGGGIHSISSLPRQVQRSLPV